MLSQRTGRPSTNSGISSTNAAIAHSKTFDRANNGGDWAFGEVWLVYVAVHSLLNQNELQPIEVHFSTSLFIACLQIIFSKLFVYKQAEPPLCPVVRLLNESPIGMLNLYAKCLLKTIVSNRKRFISIFKISSSLIFDCATKQYIWHSVINIGIYVEIF